MKKSYLKSGLALGAVLSCGAAMADSTGLTPIQNGPTVTFSSFGTIGAVQTNTDNGVYITARQGEGATKTADFGPDTLVGGQMDTKFNDYLSATVQVVSRENAISSYEPSVEWAFAKMKLGEGFEMRLGRIGAPFFMTSDFRSVGYTNVTVRTPVDVYGLVPVRSFDGGDLLYKTEIGGTSVNAQMWLGKSKILLGQEASGNEYFTLKNVAGLNISAENGPLTLRAGTMKSRMGTSGLTSFNGLLGGLHALSAAPGLSSLNEIGEDLAINGKFASFTGVGAIFDQGNWILTSEYVKRTTGSTYVSDANAWYATLGYRISTFTPYLSFSNRKITSETSVTSPTVSPLLPFPIPQTVAALVAGVNSALANSSESTSALGVRWDAGKNYDIKAEFQQIRVPADSAGVFKNVQGGSYSMDTKVNVVSLVVDFVF